MYSTDRFVEMAKRSGHSKPSDDTANEIRDRLADWEARTRANLSQSEQEIAWKNAERAFHEYGARIQSGEQWAMARRLELDSLSNERLSRESEIADIYDKFKSETDTEKKIELTKRKNRLRRELRLIDVQLRTLFSNDEMTIDEDGHED